MHTPRGTLLLMLFCLLLSESKSQNRFLNPIFYRDTSIQYNDFTFDFRKSRAKWFWFKTTVYITNTSERYAVFDVDSIFAFAPGKKRSRVHRRRRIVVGPRQELRYALRFDGTKLHNDSVWFTANKAVVTNQSPKTFEAFRIENLPKRYASIGGVEIEVLGISQNERYFKVKVRMRYNRNDHFLAIDYKKVYIKTKSGQVIHPKLKQNYRTWLTLNNHWEPANFVFPIEAGMHRDGYLYFENVFEEYGIAPIRNFKLKVLIKK